ncbi:unnamed protein product [Brassica oleracea]
MGFLLIVMNARVMVLAATNRPSELDEAILKRLPQAFEIGMPDRKEKAGIFKVVLKGERVEPDIDYHHVAHIFELCKKAAYFPIREILEEEGKGRPCPVPRLLSQLDLEKVVDWIWREFLLRRRRRKLQKASIVG